MPFSFCSFLSLLLTARNSMFEIQVKVAYTQVKGAMKQNHCLFACDHLAPRFEGQFTIFSDHQLAHTL